MSTSEKENKTTMPRDVYYYRLGKWTSTINTLISIAAALPLFYVITQLAILAIKIKIAAPEAKLVSDVIYNSIQGSIQNSVYTAAMVEFAFAPWLIAIALSFGFYITVLLAVPSGLIRKWAAKITVSQYNSKKKSIEQLETNTKKVRVELEELAVKNNAELI